MTIQTEFMLGETNQGLQILEINEKSTLFTKTHLPESYQNMLRNAIKNDDSALMEQIVLELYAAAQQTGFINAPGGYALKHLGFMLGSIGLYTSHGVKCDMTLTVRTPYSLQ